MKKLIMVVSLIGFLSGCVVAAPHHHDKYSGYDRGGVQCTQVDEANGNCEAATPHHKHHHHQSYQSDDGYTMITREGR